LALRQRNIAARVLHNESSAAGLFEAALAGGFPATGRMQAGLAPGHRADFVTLDLESPALLGVPAGYLLDALVFSSPGAAFGEVFVAGERVAAPSPERAQVFAHAMRELWAEVR
jgi:formimidoylglutamate deiminase